MVEFLICVLHSAILTIGKKYFSTASNFRSWIDNEVKNQPWGLQEPSGEDCVVADSALQWQWNSIRCVISAHVVCEGNIQQCPSPDVNSGSFIKWGISKDMFNVGTTVHYSCQEGFVLHGVSKRTCLINGSWSEKAPTCQYYDCSDQIELGKVTRGKSLLESWGNTFFPD